MKTITIKGHAMPIDEEGRVNLTDLYRMAGRPKNRKPSAFKRRKRVRDLLSCAHWQAQRGVATWAHFHLARDYAEYLGIPDDGTPEATKNPEGSDKEWDDLFAKMDAIKAKRDEDHAAMERTREEQSARDQERREASDWDQEKSRVFDGEGWKGDYDPDTAGEEWKTVYDDAMAGEEWKGEPGETSPSTRWEIGLTSPSTRWEIGLDRDFMDFILYGPEGRTIRASRN